MLEKSLNSNNCHSTLFKTFSKIWTNNFLVFAGIDWSVKASSSQRDFNHSIANLLVLRGSDIPIVDISPFDDPCLYPSWVPPGGAFQTWTQKRSLCGYEKSAVLLSNSQSPIGSLDNMVGKAWKMFASRAYIHQYTKYGLTEEDFVDSFGCLEQVVSSYKNIWGIWLWDTVSKWMADMLLLCGQFCLLLQVVTSQKHRISYLQSVK